jgi:hypothetical protein
MTFSLFDVAFVGSLTPPSAFDFLNPANIGRPVAGGYFVGLISHTANGVATHALIVAPRATGATGGGYALSTNLQWKTTQTTTANANSIFDGAANTAAMVAAGIGNHPAAKFCVDLSIGGFTDWYLPSRLELGIAYFHLKPTTQNNDTSTGSNAYSVPPRPSNYSAGFPSQTTVTAFSTSAEAFASGQSHWSSTDVISSLASAVFFGNGNLASNTKTATNPVRAFRRIAL